MHAMKLTLEEFGLPKRLFQMQEQTLLQKHSTNPKKAECYVIYNIIISPTMQW